MYISQALLTFVNYKLYHDASLAYPPHIDADAEAAGAHLSALQLRPAGAISGAISGAEVHPVDLLL